MLMKKSSPMNDEVLAKEVMQNKKPSDYLPSFN